MLFLILGGAAVLGLGGWRVMSGELTIGMLMGFYMVAGNFLRPVGRFVEFADMLQTLEADLQRLNDVLDAPADLVAAARDDGAPGPTARTEGRLRLDRTDRAAGRDLRLSAEGLAADRRLQPDHRARAAGRGGRADRIGQVHPAGAVESNDPHTVWFVEHGVLDLFVTEERDGRTVSRLKHVLRVGAGRLVFGAGASGKEASLVTVGKGLPGCRLRRMGLATLVRDASAEELTTQVDLWIAQRAASLVADITFRPRPDWAIGPGERLEAEAACTLAGRPGAVTWVAAGRQAELLDTACMQVPPSPRRSSPTAAGVVTDVRTDANQTRIGP